MSAFWFFNREFLKKPVSLHLISLLYLITVSWIILVSEYDFGNFLSYYYKSTLTLTIGRVIVIPFNFWIVTALFGIILYLQFREENKFKILQNVFISGVIIHFYLLLLTLNKDVQISEFYWPIMNTVIKVPFKAVYVQIVANLILMLFYCTWFSLLKRAEEIPACYLSLLYLPLVPFLFGIGEIYNIYLLILGFLFFLLQKNRFMKPVKSIVKKIYYDDKKFLIFIWLIALLFRFWHIYYFSLITVHPERFSADGPSYHRVAVEFMDGKVDDLWNAPFYSLFTALSYKIFGFNQFGFMTVQALLVSLNCIIIFKIARRLRLKDYICKLSAGCVALSHLLIHYSYVYNRAVPMTVLVPAAVLIILILIQEGFSKKYSFLLGCCLGAILMLSAEVLPIFIVAVVPFIFTWKWKRLLNHTLLIVLGILLLSAPLNIITYKNKKLFLPLGRTSISNKNIFSASMGKYGERLEDLGFNLTSNPLESFRKVMQTPIEIINPLAHGIWENFQGYFMDQEMIIVDPALLNREIYYSNSIIFYFYLFMTVGLFLLIFKSQITTKERFAILTVIFIPLLIYITLVGGVFRHRAPYHPFYLLFFSVGIGVLLGTFQQEVFENQITKINNKSGLSLYAKKINEFEKSKKTQFIVFSLFVILFLHVYFKNIHYTQKPYFHTNFHENYLAAQGYKTKHIHDPWNNHQYENIFFDFPESVIDISVLIVPRFKPKVNNIGLELLVDKKRVGGIEKIKQSPWYILRRGISLEKGSHSFSLKIAQLDKNIKMEKYLKINKNVIRYVNFKATDLWIYYRKVNGI